MKSNLKHEAENIVSNLQLLELLKSYGRVEIVGSVAFDLIVKKDIDIHLFIPKKNIAKIADEIVELLKDRFGFERVKISNWGHIDSIKIDVQYLHGKSGDWDIEIWITSNIKVTGFAFAKRLKKELTDKKRKTILKIKQYYFDKNLLKWGMSKKIYVAVMDYDVESVDQFKNLLTKSDFLDYFN